MNEDYKLDLEENEKVIIDTHRYGQKTKALKIGRYEDGKFGYVYLPQIEVDYKMCCISDESTKSGCVECPSKEVAIDIAIVEQNMLIGRQQQMRKDLMGE